jgi:hypothetical protein
MDGSFHPWLEERGPEGSFRSVLFSPRPNLCRLRRKREVRSSTRAIGPLAAGPAGSAVALGGKSFHSVPSGHDLGCHQSPIKLIKSILFNRIGTQPSRAVWQLACFLVIALGGAFWAVAYTNGNGMRAAKKPISSRRTPKTTVCPPTRLAGRPAAALLSGIGYQRQTWRGKSPSLPRFSVSSIGVANQTPKR